MIINNGCRLIWEGQWRSLELPLRDGRTLTSGSLRTICILVRMESTSPKWNTGGITSRYSIFHGTDIRKVMFNKLQRIYSYLHELAVLLRTRLRRWISNRLFCCLDVPRQQRPDVSTNTFHRSSNLRPLCSNYTTWLEIAHFNATGAVWGTLE